MRETEQRVHVRERGEQGVEVEVTYPNTLEMEDVQKTEMFESVKEYLMQIRLLNDDKVNYEYYHKGKDLDN